MKAAALAVLCACSAVTGPPPVKSMQINQPGAMVDVNAALVADYVTIVDFWSASCGACTIVGGMLAVQIADQPRVIVRKIDVGDGFTPVAKGYDVGALPHYNIYDRHRRLRYVLVGNDCLRAPQLARQLLAES